MKIAIMVRKLNVRGGVQRHALSLARELALEGDDVTLYTFLYDKEKYRPYPGRADDFGDNKKQF